MNPIIGQAIVIAAVLTIAFLCGRSTLRGIIAELRGEGTCAGCPGCGSCGRNAADRCACMQQMEKLRRLRETKECSDLQQEK